MIIVASPRMNDFCMSVPPAIHASYNPKLNLVEETFAEIDRTMTRNKDAWFEHKIVKMCNSCLDQARQAGERACGRLGGKAGGGGVVARLCS